MTQRERACFNSNMVRLREKHRPAQGQLLLSFNSNMVRLRVSPPRRLFLL
ncbi:hypothetical protein PORCAN_1222 [Porphyromonas crevioricanis JCM 13913]|nr:hypothetical protein PORCAN_1222 [Porphyromonas crevioricanis JCM 13913]